MIPSLQEEIEKNRQEAISDITSAAGLVIQTRYRDNYGYIMVVAIERQTLQHSAEYLDVDIRGEEGNWMALQEVGGENEFLPSVVYQELNAIYKGLLDHLAEVQGLVLPEGQPNDTSKL